MNELPLHEKTFRCQVNADLFRRVALAMSREETRYYLHGVNVEPHPEGGATMTATNGYILIHLRDPNGFCEGAATLRLDDRMLNAIKPFKRGKTSHPLMLVVTGKRAGLLEHSASKKVANVGGRDVLFREVELFGVTLKHLQWENLLIGGSFPDWRRDVLKPVLSWEASALNPHFLATIGDALGGAVTLYRTGDVKDSGGPFLVLGDGRFEGFALLMPMRNPANVPPWWPKALEPPAPRTSDMAAVVAAQEAANA